MNSFACGIQSDEFASIYEEAMEAWKEILEEDFED